MDLTIDRLHNTIVNIVNRGWSKSETVAVIVARERLGPLQPTWTIVNEMKQTKKLVFDKKS